MTDSGIGRPGGLSSRAAPEVAALRASIPDAEALDALAERVAALPHQSRSINCEISALFGEQFNHNYLGYLDGANRLAIDGYSWCAGVSFDDDTGERRPWANVHSGAVYPRRVDISINAASEAIALTAAWLRAQAIESRRAETQSGSVHESAVPQECAQEVSHD